MNTNNNLNNSNQNTDFSKVDFNLDNIENLDNNPIQREYMGNPDQNPFQKTNLNDLKSESINKVNPIEKDDKSVSSLQESHKKIDDNHQRDLNRNWSLTEQWTNRSMYKVVQEHKKDLFNASAEYKIKFYRTVLDGRLEALSEKTNTGLMMIKAHYRQRVASFMMTKMSDLSKEVKVRQHDFLGMMMEKHDYVAKLENYPQLKNQYVNSILQEGERYMNFLDRLLLRFENIIDEQLKRYQD
ncbi:hypothetical protein R3X25_02305 [Lutibacter sp. TH_r2]|uniref:hypothetical protein n=1 Tax=Lutibacter sp. TH_r2 TaxID=3082083 RepID=UPI0029554ECC|nr:hypothetical protein [Lutibacter sp. TH_r2]MDV7186101.1 hypothetical protein [Lutibacter sp. TH_r2]